MLCGAKSENLELAEALTPPLLILKPTCVDLTVPAGAFSVRCTIKLALLSMHSPSRESRSFFRSMLYDVARMGPAFSFDPTLVVTAVALIRVSAMSIYINNMSIDSTFGISTT